MFFRLPSGALILIIALCGPAAAQDDGARRASPAASATPTSSTGGINVDRLPIDLQRIERQLRQSPSEREEHDGLHLRYFIDVYGTTPRIQLFTPDDNLASGPTPWGGPTHQDMLEVMTPKEFRAPVMDFNGLMRWLSDKMSR